MSFTPHIGKSRRSLITWFISYVIRHRGHGTRLVDWCTSLADIENVPVGISAVPNSVGVALKAGFIEQEIVHVEAYDIELGDKQVRRVESVELWIGIRQPHRPLKEVM